MISDLKSIFNDPFFLPKVLSVTAVAYMANAAITSVTQINAERQATLEEDGSQFQLFFEWRRGDDFFFLREIKENNDIYFYSFFENKPVLLNRYKALAQPNGHIGYGPEELIDISSDERQQTRAIAKACYIARQMAAVEQGFIRAPVDHVTNDGKNFIKAHCIIP